MCVGVRISAWVGESQGIIFCVGVSVQHLGGVSYLFRIDCVRLNKSANIRIVETGNKKALFGGSNKA